MNDHGLAGPPPVQGVWRVLYILLGLFFIGLGVIGAVLPVLPTTPFLLLASFFLVRSSHRLNHWLLRSRLFGGLLRDWQRHRGVRPRTKVTAVAVLLIAVTASALLANLPPALLVLLFVLAGIGLTVVLRLPLVRDVAPPAPNPREENASV